MAKTLSIKISDEEKNRLKRIASERQTSLSALIREGIDQVIEKGDVTPSCYDLMSDIFENPKGLGSSGLGDLSTNKARLKNIGRK